MCGICGFVKHLQKADGGDAVIVKKMNDTLLHRGPDAQEIHLFDNVALGFSRLSIIGLENGMQPMYNEDETVVLICNGEIFNYVELKEQLIARGHVFNTHSDVEVILHLYEEHGMGFLNQLNGQFAFALYDKRKKVMFCARDQMGIIPFFYTVVDKTFIFGSEIKALLEHPLVAPEVDLTGLDQIFTFAGLISPRTMFKNIHSLENGCYLHVDKEARVSRFEYWDLIFPEGEALLNDKPESWYVDRLEELFDKAIELRLRADVPSGLYLSGGLDSSMIAMKMKHLTPNIIKDAFSIDFIDARHSESHYQKLISRSSNTRLNQKTFFADDIVDKLKLSIYHSECPIKETYNTASLSLSEAVRAKGIKVILSGEGADEFFAGYVGYRFDKMRAANFIENTSSAAEKELRQSIWGDKNFFYEKNFLEFDNIKKRLYSKAVRENFDSVNCLNHNLINKDRIQNLDILNKRCYIDYKIRLVDHLVSDHGDRMALANSVEVRYPFLDKDLVEFSTQIPSSLKLHDFTEKYILKKMASRFVPKEVCEREKFHFIAPGSAFLLRKNIDYIEHLLSYSTIEKQGYFDPNEIERLKKIYRQDGFTINEPYESDLLIVVLTFGVFLDHFFN